MPQARILNKSETPNEGWPYRQPESGELFRARTWRSLVRLIRPHREAMGYDTSEGWEERLEGEVLEQNPHLREPPTLSLDVLKRFVKTAASWFVGGGQFVDQAEANRRASVCVSCHHNRSASGGCGTLCEMTAEATQALSGHSTPHDDKLKNCAVCSCFNRLKIWIPMDQINNDGISNEDWPNFCWQRNDG